MNRLKNLLGVFAFSLLILGLPSFASAQWGGGGGGGGNSRNDPYGRGTYGRNGGYGNGNVQSAVRRLKDTSRDFARRLDRELDNSRINGTNREDDLNRLANDFKNAASRLENRFDNGRNMDRSYNEAQQVLSLGNQLERALGRSRANRSMQGDWYSISQDLRTIESVYGYNNGNNRNYPNSGYPGGNYPGGNNRGGNNGGWRNRIPFPFPF